MRHPDWITPPSTRREKNRRGENDAVLDPVTARCPGLAGLGALAGALPGRVLRSAPAP